MDKPYICSLDIHYTTLNDIHLRDLSPELNVIYGQNESGKSRIKSFLEWMMFASSKNIESLSPAARKVAFRFVDTSPQGTISLRTPREESVVLTQQLDNSKLSTTLSSANFSTADVVHLLTDDLSLAHYRNVFSLSLDELTKKQSEVLLTQDSSAEVFLSAAQTGTGVSLSALISALNSAKEELFSESGNATKRAINKLVRDINEIDKQVRLIRRDQKNEVSYDDEIEGCENKLTEINTSLAVISREIDAAQLNVNYFSTYSEYEKLVSAEPLSINSALVNMSIDIETLVKQCEHHLGDEKELTQLKSQQAELDESTLHMAETLGETLEPEKVTSFARSHEFRSALLAERDERQTYAHELSRARETFDRENGELTLLTTQASELADQLEELNSPAYIVKKRAGDKTAVASKPTLTEKKPYISMATIVLGLACILAGVLSGQYIAAGAGMLVTAFGIGMYLMRDKDSAIVTVATPTNMVSFEITNAERELSGVHTRIKHHETQIAAHLAKLKELEDARSKDRNGFEKHLVQAGFDRDVDPMRVELYLSDLDSYNELVRVSKDISKRIDAVQTWFTIFYGKIQQLQEQAKGTTCERNEQITSLVGAQTWLTSLLELSLEHKTRESQLMDRDSRTRQLEKILASQFLNIENAKKIYAALSLEDVKESISTRAAHKAELEEQRADINRQIGSMKSDAAHASQETELQDLLLSRQSMTEELNYLHHKYAVAYTAHSLAEKAFIEGQRKNQPEVLNRASEFFAQATSNRWTNISIGLDDSTRAKEPVVTMTVSGNQETLHANELSKGTQEQLYLSLRLALMQTSTRGQHIPALFDDIAVNADRERFASLSPLIGEVSRTRQVFYFTCHDWVRDELAASAGAHIITL